MKVVRNICGAISSPSSDTREVKGNQLKKIKCMAQVKIRGWAILLVYICILFFSYLDSTEKRQLKVSLYLTCIFLVWIELYISSPVLCSCLSASQSGLGAMAHFQQGQAYHIPTTLHIIPSEFT